METLPKAVIFDHSTILNQSTEITTGLAQTMQRLQSLGVKLVVFSTHSQAGFAQRIAACGYPPVDLFLTRDDVGANKGSPAWVTTAAERLELPVHRFFYLGDDDLDWKTAINAGVLYLHARWRGPIPAGVTAFGTQDPERLYRFLSHFFLPPPRWEYTLDDPSRRLCVRGLLNAGVRLAADPPGASFTLQDVFTYENARQVGGQSARNLLMTHAIANLYAEGLIGTGCRFAVYPCSTPGTTNDIFTEYLRPASCFFHGWLQERLLFRAVQAEDTSLARYQHRPVFFSNQTNTVHVHPDLEGSAHLVGKHIVVFDDFTTSGMSLEWARNLLCAAGAASVVLVTFGKYAVKHPARYTAYDALPDQPVLPFGLNQYGDRQFAETELHLDRSEAGRQVTEEMFQCWVQGVPYPVTTL